MAKKATKKLTFRQRLRAAAAEDLAKIKRKVVDAGKAEVEAAGLNISHYDIFRALSVGKNKTLEDHLITQLANQREEELEALYNKQQDLELEDKQ